MTVQPKGPWLLLGAAFLAACSAAPSPQASVPAAAGRRAVPGPATSTTSGSAAATTTSTGPDAPTTTGSSQTPPTSQPRQAAPGPVGAAAAASCPVNLASTLASTASAKQLITVEGVSYTSTVATVQTWQRDGACWTPVAGPWTGRVGQNGFSDHHVEGDGTTPTGIYGIGPVMYGNAPNPGVQEPYHQLVCGDWWDEDPRSAQYNTFQHVPCGQTPPFGGGSEALWTEKAPYPSFAVIDYNTDPVVPYAGSAIFLHADTGTPTDGCVSIPLAQLDQVLRWINPADSPAVVMAPAAEIGRF